MKLAVTYADGQVFPHFGQCNQFKIYDVNDGKIGFSMVISAAGEGHAPRVSFLRMLGVQVLLCGGIGPSAVQMLEDLAITPIFGVSGDADKAVEDFMAGKLTENSAELCSQARPDGIHGCGFGCEGGCSEH